MKLGDSYYGEMRDKMELKTTDEIDRAACFLEGHGYRFLIEFGIANAIEKAQALRRELTLKKKFRPRFAQRK